MLRKVGMRAALMAGVMVPGLAMADEVTAYRAFIADQDQGVVNVLDVAAGQVIETFALEGPATLYASESGRTVFAVQGDADIVQAIDTGIAIDDHGDHGDIDISDPALRAGAIEGDYPVHFVEHHGTVALFFDGEGVVKVIGEDGFGTDEPRIVDAGAPHHGAAAAYGDFVVVTEPHPEDPSNLPIGVRVLGPDDQPVGGLHDCPGLHGEASSGNLLAIACDTGLLMVTSGAQGPRIDHLAYGADLPDGKVSTVLGGAGIQYFLGNYGADRVVLIDPAEASFRLVDLPTRRVHFAVDPVRPQFAYIFTEDGNLHRLNVLSGEIVKTLALTEPYSMDGHWSDPRPRIAVAGNDILVTDPRASLVHKIDATRFEVGDAIAIEGLPMNIAVAGGSGTMH